MQDLVVAFVNALVATWQAPCAHQVTAPFGSFGCEIVRGGNFDSSTWMSWTMKSERSPDRIIVFEHVDDLLPHVDVLVGV
jgi:hypothetical protein